MTRGARLLLAALALAVAIVAIPAQAGDGLVRRASREAGFSVAVPATWHYKDASYPSDHSTEYWTEHVSAPTPLV